MKPILITIALLTVSSLVHAQQPPPRNPKDPDSAIQRDPTMKVVEIGPQAIFTAVEHEPEFPGGIEKLYRYLGRNLRYPAAAKENNVQGKVFVTFVVEKDGSLTGIKISKSLSPETDAEAIRLMKASPKWNPGIQNGRPVRVLYTIPVDFELAN
ncbi:MAG TPA: energy transducer TonB [Mucilaginibacter sp.]|jgi:protein TonB|nr:energy transducer TonB [Mucilaginibacter sp.]